MSRPKPCPPVAVPAPLGTAREIGKNTCPPPGADFDGMGRGSLRPHARNSGGRGAMAVILVVDDQDYVRDLLRRVLEQAGHQAVLAGTGEEALALLRARPVD